VTRALAIISLLALAGCGSLATGALKTAAGAALGGDSGPSLDVQAGKNNNRASLGGSSSVTEVKVAPEIRDSEIGKVEQDNRTDTGPKTVSSENVEALTVNEFPTWLIVAMLGIVVLFGIVGWFSPQPKWLRKRIEAHS
jgi:hypothetical protein